MAYYSGYQSTAFQRTAFQVVSGAAAVAPSASNWYRGPAHDVERRNREYREALKLEQIKQERIIEMRLEAQALKIQERELANHNDKQSQRQLAALQAQVEQLMLEIQIELVKLQELHKISVIKRNNIALLLLAMSTPFGMGGSLMM